MKNEFLIGVSILVVVFSLSINYSNNESFNLSFLPLRDNEALAQCESPVIYVLYQ